MREYYWIVTYEERQHKNKKVLCEDGSPKVDSVTVGPFMDEQKMRDFCDKNIHLSYKTFKCGERVREKAAKKIKAGEAEEI